jgi:hypothetical protein
MQLIRALNSNKITCFCSSGDDPSAAARTVASTAKEACQYSSLLFSDLLVPQTPQSCIKFNTPLKSICLLASAGQNPSNLILSLAVCLESPGGLAYRIVSSLTVPEIFLSAA